MPQDWRDHFNNLRPPVDNRLKGTSSWRNLLSGRDRETPPGWTPEAEAEKAEA
jgi:hypothetical protein